VNLKHVDLKTSLSLLVAGRRARRAFDAAVRDLDAGPLPDAVAARTRAPRADARPTLALRVFHRALVAVADERAPANPCLPRSLALYDEARRRGLGVRLVVGVRLDGGEVASHAWLTLHGAPFLEVPETGARFRVIADLPA
jgi:hypothetical protein